MLFPPCITPLGDFLAAADLESELGPACFRSFPTSNTPAHWDVHRLTGELERSVSSGGKIKAVEGRRGLDGGGCSYSTDVHNVYFTDTLVFVGGPRRSLGCVVSASYAVSFGAA